MNLAIFLDWFRERLRHSLLVKKWPVGQRPYSFRTPAASARTDRIKNMRHGLRARLCHAMAVLTMITPTDLIAADQKGIGYNGPMKLTEQTPPQLAETIADFNALGVRWVRLDFDWSEIQPTNGPYQLAGYDAAIKALTAGGIHVLGVIDYTPGWANGGKPSKFFPPTDVGEYGRFAGELGRRYGPMGVHAWEIWNEQNVSQFWGPAPNPQRYVVLLNSAYQALHDADKNAVVVTGGLAQPSNSRTSMTASDFLEAIYAAGGSSWFDAVGNHPYSSPYMPSDRSLSNNWQKMAAASRSLRGLMVANGDTSKKLWITEYGAPTGGIDAYSQKIVISEEQQARMVREAYSLIPTYSWVGPLFWYEYQDLCPAAANESSECYYGLVRYDGSRKPAYDAYRSAKD